jgi:hypothetical protein
VKVGRLEFQCIVRTALLIGQMLWKAEGLCKDATVSRGKVVWCYTCFLARVHPAGVQWMPSSSDGVRSRLVGVMLTQDLGLCTTGLT